MLQHKNPLGFAVLNRPSNRGDADGPICTRQNCDLVLADSIDDDDSYSGVDRRDLNASEIYAISTHQLLRNLSEMIVADSPKQRDLRASTTSSERLVGAFTARLESERRS